MDDDGLPVVGPGVDYTRVAPIQQKRTLAFLNYFIVRTTSFLNHFGSLCDEKLQNLLIRIQRLEASMCILEAKLSSIPGTAQVSKEVHKESSSNSAAPQHQVQNGLSTEVTKDPVPEKPAEQEQRESENPVSKDPRFAKYFKMLSVGIPLGAVQIKMKSEGVDPDILNDPNAPAPASATAVLASSSEAVNSDSEESSFSD
ncbi:WASH complex subunit 3-like [Ornithodoros turicata]|uniref:WASH complex subunit 3-like n=1 Tax=Ornithodoros turicata TaxID=34597 RepID=UPI00313889E6